MGMAARPVFWNKNCHGNNFVSLPIQTLMNRIQMIEVWGIRWSNKCWLQKGETKDRICTRRPFCDLLWTRFIVQEYEVFKTWWKTLKSPGIWQCVNWQWLTSPRACCLHLHGLCNLFLHYTDPQDCDRKLHQSTIYQVTPRHTRVVLLNLHNRPYPDLM